MILVTLYLKCLSMLDSHKAVEKRVIIIIVIFIIIIITIIIMSIPCRLRQDVQPGL